MSQALFPQIEHVGCVKVSAGMLRIDVKIVQAAISRSDVPRLLNTKIPVPVWDMTPVWNRTGEPVEVGRAWITGTGKAVMYSIAGRNYISPLSQVRGVVEGLRKTANVSTIEWLPALPTINQTVPSAVTA